MVATAALFAACAAACLGLSAASAQPVPEDRVVLVLAPYLDWADLSPSSTPAIWALADSGAIGAVNARSRGHLPGEKASPVEGALTISAGAWAIQNATAPAAYDVGERYEVGTAAEAFRRTTGERVEQNRIVFLGMPMTQRTNDERSYDIVLGTLGQAIADADGVTAAIGNSDVGYVTGEQRKVRPAALAAMNQQGLVPLGDVSTRMLREDPWAPFGIETDLERFSTSLARVSSQIGDVEGPGLVVLDAGDSYRVAKFRSQVTDDIYAEHRARALESLDSVVGMAVERFPDATVIVASQSTGDPAQGDPEGLGPLIISSPGYDGYLTSDSTQRTGLTTNLDITSTILDLFGLEQPVQVLGNPLRSVPSADTTAERIARLASLNDAAIAVDGAKPLVANAFVVFTVAILAFAAFVIARAQHWTKRALGVASRLLKASLLLVLAVPPAAWLMFLVRPLPTTSMEAGLALLVTAAVIWAIGLLLWWKTPMRVPVGVLALGTVAVIGIDQYLDAPASFTNFFGYSPLLGARFYGMGNEAAAIMFGAAIVGIALLFDQWPGTRATAIGKRVVLPALGVFVVFTAAAPFLGANIGVAVWGVVGFGLAYILMNGHRVSWWGILGLLVGVVLVIVVFAAIDLFGGGAQTHLGQALGSAQQGGLGELWTIVVRKAETNIRVLTATNWAYILIATLAFLGFMRWRPHGDFADTLQENPDFADAITVSLAAGLVAYFTEDSGIVIPALEVFYVGVALSWLMLSRIAPLPTKVPARADSHDENTSAR
jgi:hypothetical protein